MNKLKVLGTMCLLGITTLFFPSCSEDDEKKVAPDGTMIANVDGQHWSSNTASAVIANGVITVVGINGSTITLSADGTQAGTYSITGHDQSLSFNTVSLSPENASLENPVYASTYYAEGEVVGEVKITEIDEANKTISGTFSCKIKRMVPEEKEVIIKEGSFTKITYSTEPGSNPENEFSAKVNGSNFPAATVGGIQALGKLTLNFAKSNADAIALTLPDNVAVGTHDLEGIGSTYSGIYSTSSNTYEAVSGSVTITEHNTTTDLIKGTFSFNGELFPMGGGNVSVTEGSFTVYY